MMMTEVSPRYYSPVCSVIKYSHILVLETKGLDLSTLKHSSLNSSHIPVDFQPGDHVEVYQGGEIGVHGIVDSVTNNEVTFTSEVGVNPPKITLPISSLRKSFRE